MICSCGCCGCCCRRWSCCCCCSSGKQGWWWSSHHTFFYFCVPMMCTAGFFCNPLKMKMWYVICMPASAAVGVWVWDSFANKSWKPIKKQAVSEWILLGWIEMSLVKVLACKNWGRVRIPCVVSDLVDTYFSQSVDKKSPTSQFSPFGEQRQRAK